MGHGRIQCCCEHMLRAQVCKTTTDTVFTKFSHCLDLVALKFLLKKTSPVGLLMNSYISLQYFPLERSPELQRGPFLITQKHGISAED